MPAALRALACLLVLLSTASAQGWLDPSSLPAGTDYYGDWMMWWSTNREEFLCRTDPAAASRPTDSENLKLVSGDACRAQIIPALVHALKDNEKQIREAAAIALGTCGDAQDVATLGKVLADRDRVVSEAAALGLGMLRSPEAETILGKLMADPATQERKRGIAALALGLSGGEAAQKPLFDGLGSDKSEKYEACRMIGACLWSGGDVGDPRTERCPLASNAVVKALKGQEKRRKLVSFGAAAFSKSRDAAAKPFLLAALKEPRFDIRAAAAISVGRVIRADDKDGTRAVINALQTEAHILPVRFLIISLGRIGGPDATAAIAKEFSSGDKLRRAFGAIALGIAGAADYAPKMRQDLLGSTEDRLKGALAVALGILKDSDSFVPITQMCQGKPNDELLSYLVWFFALSQNREGSKTLEKVLAGSRVAETQEAAAIALGCLGAVESIEHLARHLQGSTVESVRKAAATALGRMRDQRGVDALLRAAKGDQSPVVRAAAILALGSVARPTNLSPIARIAIDAYYGIMNEAIDETVTRVGSLMKTTEEGGGQGVK